MQKFLKNKQGVTLIALVITIVIIVILAAVSINMLIGDNGLITKAHESSKQMQIASGKEEIDLQVLDLVTGKVLKGENCSLEYIKQELPKRLNLSVTGEKGEPLQAIYVDYKNYEYEIDNQFIVKYAGEGNYKERPTLILSLDKTQTGVEKVIITAEAEIIDGTIEEIKNPKGESKKGNNTTYEVTENGEYTFIATSNRGRVTSKTINVNNIKKQGIDLTGLVTGEDTGHNHIFSKKFDDNNHYEECIICGLKQNIVAHNITREIANKDMAVCHPKNYYINSCTCGYYKIEHEKHTTNNQLITDKTTMAHHTTCSICKQWPLDESCTKSDGSKITCNNLGTCTKCKYEYNTKTHRNIYDKGICVSCREQLIEVLENSYVYNEQNNQYTFTSKFKIIDPNVHILDGTGWTWDEDDGFKQISVTNSRNDGIETLVAVMEPVNKFQGELQYAGRLLYQYGTDVNDKNNICFEQYIVPKTHETEIKDIQVIDIGENQGWTQQKQITVKGMDNWSNNVKISMQNSSGNTIYNEVIVPVNNNNYEYTFIPELEAGKQGEIYTITVKDVFGNSKTKNITISNIDFKAPQLVSDANYTEEWSTTKEITIEAVDEGIGNVQIAFNNENDYQLGKLENGKYTRKYLFTGEVYESVQGGIYLKDGLDNKQMIPIKIGKIDNTSPTITNVETRKEGENIVVTINANDINEKLGKEGSGISGYAISTSKELPTDISYGKSNEIKVEKAGTYYIYVKDNVGNISARYEFNI